MNDSDFPVNDQLPEGDNVVAADSAPSPSSEAEQILSEIPGIFDSAPSELAEAQDALVAAAPDSPSGDTEAGDTALLKIKEYSENVSMAQATVPAAYPYSLLITGRLTDHEKEKLLDLLSRENMGIREVDLEPQLEAGRILIPRISEFAGVLIVQALRAASVEMELGPSDLIFASENTRDESFVPMSGSEDVAWSSSEASHPAEALPLTSESSIPGVNSFTVIDTLTATAALRSDVVETEKSSEYQEALDALQRELKYKAYRRGAQAIVSFSIQLAALNLPTHYRLTVTGLAVKLPSAGLSSLPGWN